GEATADAGDLESGVTVGRDAFWSGARRDLDLGLGQEHRPQQIRARRELSRWPTEAHLTLLHELGARGDAGGDVHGLLDDDDRRTVGVDLTYDVDERADDCRRQTERELVDQQQPRPTKQGLGQ